jgi:hypothetical protein
VPDEELDGVGVRAGSLELGDEALAEGVVWAALPGFLADAGPLPAALQVSGASHALSRFGAVRGDHPLVLAFPRRIETRCWEIASRAR